MQTPWLHNVCLALMVVASSSCVQAQRFFNDAYLEASRQSGFEHTPYTLKIFQDNYTPITEPPIPGSEMQWQLAVKHKTKDVRMYVNISPDVVVFGDRRSANLPGIYKCDFIASEDHSDLAHLYRADQMFIAWGENCSSTVGDWGHAVFFSYLHGDHLAELYFFYSDWDELDPEMETLLECFRFIPDAESLSGRSGIGVALGYDLDTWSWQFTRVLEDSPAYKAGILPGDYLRAVNNYGFNQVDYHTLHYALTGEAETSVQVQVDRYGNPYTFQITRQPFDRTKETPLISKQDIDYEGLVIGQALMAFMLHSPTKCKGEMQEETQYPGLRYTFSNTCNILPDQGGAFYQERYTEKNKYSIEFNLYSGSLDSMQIRYDELAITLTNYLKQFGLKASDRVENNIYFKPDGPSEFGWVRLAMELLGDEATIFVTVGFPGKEK